MKGPCFTPDQPVKTETVQLEKKRPAFDSGGQEVHSVSKHYWYLVLNMCYMNMILFRPYPNSHILCVRHSPL